MRLRKGIRMSQDSLFLRALPAAEVFDRFIKLVPEVFPDETVHFQITTNVSGMNHTENVSSARVLSEAAKQFRTMIHDRPHVVAQTATIHIHGNVGMKVGYSTDDGIVARLRVEFPQKERAIRALNAVEKHFNLTNYADLVRTASPVVDQSAIQLRERSVADLQEAVKKLASFLAEMAEREATTREKLNADMQAKQQERSDQLEREYRERMAEVDRHRSENDELHKKRVEEFAAEVAKFDSRESKLVRRTLLDKITQETDVAGKAGVSENTHSKRWWIHVFVWIALLSSGTLAVVFANKILSAQTVDWHFIAPLSAGVLSFVATMVYYLKWNDRWFREHADSEFAAQRLKMDILRASWIAELVHEWAKEGKGDLPPELITAYSRNLFTGGKGSRLSEHPMDHMTSLLKRATEIQVGKTGFSVKGAGRKDGNA